VKGSAFHSTEARIIDLKVLALFDAPAEGASMEAAWTTFLEHYDRTIRFTCAYWMRRFGRTDETEDRIQDVYEKLCRDDFKAIRAFKPGRAKVTTWLTTIANNVCKGWVRSRDRSVFVAESEPGVGPDRADPSWISVTELVGQAEDAQESIRALSECINALDSKRRLMMVTRLLCQVAFDRRPSITEVGRMHGASPQTTKYRLDRAMELLRECLASGGPSGGTAS
jgi:RNA polymerase sigma factor (sigma-70 family)